MFYFLLVVLSPNVIWIYSEAAASMNSISQSAIPSKQLRWSSFLEGSGGVVTPSLKNAFYKKKKRLHSHLILRFCLDLGNKNIKILLQLLEKRLAITSILPYIFIG